MTNPKDAELRELFLDLCKLVRDLVDGDTSSNFAVKEIIRIEEKAEKLFDETQTL